MIILSAQYNFIDLSFYILALSFLMYIVIMAGGQGTRLWPMSRQNKPKQLFNLISDQSLLKDTLKRLKGVKPDKIFIATNQAYSSAIQEQLPQIPSKNIVNEPLARGTASCIGLNTAIIYRQDPQAVIAVLSSDHYIEKEKKFNKILNTATELAKRDNKVVTLGINPDYPATEYGYINIDDSIDLPAINRLKVFKAKKFIEKPDLTTAKKYLKSWKYLWNAGIFIYPAQLMIDLFQKHLPDSYKIINKIIQAKDGQEVSRIIEKDYKFMTDITIDYGIMEKLSELLVIPTDVGWSDIGNWSSLKDVLSKDKEENIIKGNVIAIDTENSLLYGNHKPIAVLGAKDLIVVDTDDIILVCPKNKAADMKEMVAHLKTNNFKKFL